MITDSDYRDLHRWYQNTFVRVFGKLGELHTIDRPSEKIASLGLRELEFPFATTYVCIDSLKDIEPVHFTPTMVDTGTPVGSIFVSRTTVRCYKKSLWPETFYLPHYVRWLVRPVGADFRMKSLARSYLLGKCKMYTPEQAAQRVVDGEALFSAITKDISVGVLPHHDRYVATKRDAVVGVFIKRKKSSPVSRLVLSAPNGHLQDEFSKYIHTVEVE